MSAFNIFNRYNGQKWNQRVSLPRGASRETTRRLRIIREVFGENWRHQFPEESISSVYRRAVQDTREVVYARVTPETKRALRKLADLWEMELSEVIEALIEESYDAETDWDDFEDELAAIKKLCSETSALVGKQK